MCGIAGIVSPEADEPLEPTVARMTRMLLHRGPDHSATCKAPHMAFGATRLAILDLSAAANQPMREASGLTIVLNGEIYNFLELRSELVSLGYAFQTKSDTEVVLAAFRTWGPACQLRFNGMWAFAIWDPAQRSLFLSRDRFGVKPLFIARRGQRILFASEVKSLLAAGCPFRPDLDAIESFRRFEGEGSLFEGIETLPPGTCLTWMPGAGQSTTRWWLTADHVTPVVMSREERIELFRETFFDAVKIRLRSDVNIAVSLSGGLDSSSIFAAIHHLRGGQAIRNPTDGRAIVVRAFVMSFPGEPIDETEQAGELVRWIGESATFIEASPSDFRELVEEVVWHQEAVTWNAAVLVYHKLYAAIAQHGFRVVLEGHGSDEALGGYPQFAYVRLQESVLRHEWRAAMDAARTLSAVSNPALGHVPHSPIRNLLVGAGRALLARARGRARLDSLHGSRMKEALYLAFHEQILPSMLRVYDRASMAHSLESRGPFLDYRLVTLAFSLPDEDLISQGSTKRILREAMQPFLPASTISRVKKVGFIAPQPSWFRQPAVLHAFSEAVVDGTLRRANVDERRFEQHIGKLADGVADWRTMNAVWADYAYAIWFDRFSRFQTETQ